MEGEIKLVGHTHLNAVNQNITEGEFFIILKQEQIKNRKTPIIVSVYSGDELIEDVKTNFMGQVKK
jgi:hypothetical protein